MRANTGSSLLIAFLAIAGMLELVVGRDSPGAPPTTLWIAIPTVGVLVLLLLARRRFPFAAPAGYWLLAAAISFGDGVLAFVGSLSIVGLASAFLLGNLRNPLKAGAGLIIMLVGIVIVVYNIPGETVSDLVFIPSGTWSPGSRATRCVNVPSGRRRRKCAQLWPSGSAMQRHASQWPRSARIARELHDIVAHAMSVMVLQVGAVRHKLPHGLEEDRDALGRVERAGRRALAEMRRLLGAMRRDGDGLDLRPNPASTGWTRYWRTSSAPGFRLSCTKAIPTSFRGRSTSRPIESSRRA